jgi:hypothetical protein
MPASIIARIEQFATDKARAPGLIFSDRRGNEYDFPNEELDPLPHPEQIAPYPDYPADLPGIALLPPDAAYDDAQPQPYQPVTNEDRAIQAANNAGISLSPHASDEQFPEPTNDTIYFDAHDENFDSGPHQPDLPQTVPPSPQRVIPDTFDAPLRR